MRIHELSKMINVSNKEIIAKLAGLGISVKSHMSKVDDEALKKLEYIFGKKVATAAKKKAATAKPKKAVVAKKAPKIKVKPAATKPKKESKEKTAPVKVPVEKETRVKKPAKKKTAIKNRTCTHGKSNTCASRKTSERSRFRKNNEIQEQTRDAEGL